MPLVDGKLNGHYKRLLIPFADLGAEAKALANSLSELQQQGRKGTPSGADLTTGFIRLFAEHRTGKKWPQIPGLPGMIPTILADWRTGKADLRLTNQTVSPREMLRAQAQGWRYVTVSFEHALAGEPIEGTRDAFEFALHDLGHAYAFFKADYHPQGQVAFFAELLSDLDTLAPYAESDTKFAADLEYCMADMNSHPEHLRQYLQGVIVELFLRRRSETGEKHEQSEAELAALLAQLISLRSLRAPRAIGHTPLIAAT